MVRLCIRTKTDERPLRKRAQRWSRSSTKSDAFLLRPFTPVAFPTANLCCISCLRQRPEVAGPVPLVVLEWCEPEAGACKSKRTGITNRLEQNKEPCSQPIHKPAPSAHIFFHFNFLPFFPPAGSLPACAPFSSFPPPARETQSFPPTEEIPANEGNAPPRS